MSNLEIDIVEQRFNASDGWEITGDLYSGPSPQWAVLVSAGTGFPRRFYRHIAEFLAQRGAIVLTYDYRGIGASRNGSLAGSEIEYTDWGRYDTPAAIDHLAKAAPSLPINHICHSVGGHFIGLMPNHKRIKKHAFLSVGSGYIWHHHWQNISLEASFWWLIGPYSLARWGYVKPVAGWKGEPLPPRVFLTWRKWCHRANYLASDLNGVLRPHHYEAVTAPIRSWVFSDDPIANKRTAQVLLDCYPNAAKALSLATPEDYGLDRIGHEGAFLRGREKLWAEVSNWLFEK